jgi:2-amino-1-hydroxyethylphosphonate dioxygenase (glycine-forming)
MKLKQIAILSFLFLVFPIRGEVSGMFEITKAEVVSCLFELLQTAGQKSYNQEGFTYLDHGLECAYQAALTSSDEEIIVAALLHHIGFLCGDFETEEDPNAIENMDHKEIGKSFLEECGFSPRICELTKGVLEAKRYLAFQDPHFFDSLSLEEVAIFSKQGGVMTENEAFIFEKDPLFREKLLIYEIEKKSTKLHPNALSLSDYQELLEKYIGME